MESGQKKNTGLYNKIANIVVVVVVVLVAIIAVTRVVSYAKGYNSIFGTALIAVESDSMKGNYKDSFQRGDLLFVDVLDDEEKLNIQPKDIVTFKHYDQTLRKEIVITHRVIAVSPYGETIVLTTKGDNNKDGGQETVYLGNVIGKYKEQKIGGIGYLPIFFASQWGFFSIVVVPCFLIVIYCIYRVIVSIKAYNKEKVSATDGAETVVVIPEDKDSKIRELEEQLKALKANDTKAAQSQVLEPSLKNDEVQNEQTVVKKKRTGAKKAGSVEKNPEGEGV